MLVVGTRGRSLGGFQSLVNTNSFSKYCLQYSPIPTVVVRDYEKRKKKKEKRYADPSRHSYVAMLAANQGKHEADSENSSLYDMEARLSPDEEAHKVAAAIGLPASFDPTLKPINLEAYLHTRRSSTPTIADIIDSPKVGGSSLASPVTPTSTTVVPTGDSDDEDSGDEDDAEFEVTSSQGLVPSPENEHAQRKRLHEMEVDEAAALRKKTAEGSADDDDES